MRKLSAALEEAGQTQSQQMMRCFIPNKCTIFGTKDKENKMDSIAHIGLCSCSQLAAACEEKKPHNIRARFTAYTHPDLLPLTTPTGSQPHFLVELLYDNKGDICSKRVLCDTVNYVN